MTPPKNLKLRKPYCKKCGALKDKFYLHKNRKKNKAYWDAGCSICIRNRSREYGKKHPEKLREFNRKTIKKLYDCYVRGCLVRGGFENPTQEIIELKRLYIKLTREIKTKNK